MGPRRAAAHDRDVGEGARSKVARGLRVLVVDDEALIRWSLVETLTSGGHTVVEAGDAAGALRTVTESAAPFDVVLLDFRLPDSSDLALLSRLKRLSPATRIILMTAFGTPEMRRAATELGASCVLDKPFEMDDVAPLLSGGAS